MSGEWISITDASERLTKAGDVVTRSSLSRYLSKHSDALKTQKRGRQTLVDYEALLAHRSENIRIEEGLEYSEPTPRPSSRGVEGPVTKANGAARKVLADAELREIALAKARKQVTPTAEVEKAGRDSIALMVSAFERAVETEAATLSVKYGWDERTLRLALKKFSRVGLDVFHREMLKSLDDFKRLEDAPLFDGETATDQVTEILQ